MGGGGEGVGERVRIHGLHSVSPCTVVVLLVLSQMPLALVFAENADQRPLSLIHQTCSVRCSCAHSHASICCREAVVYSSDVDHFEMLPGQAVNAP